jgi:hypothetical protein
MTDLLMTLATAGGLSALVTWAFVAAQKRMKILQSAWEEAARRLGGRCDPKRLSIEAVVDDVTVIVETYTVSNGKSSVTYTRLRAYAEAPAGLRLAVSRESIFSTVGKALGAQDVVVGDTHFDELFVVKASDEALARAWLTPEVTAKLTSVPEYTHRLRDSQVESTRAGIEPNSSELVRVAHATACLAGRGARLRADWRALALALGGGVGAELWTEETPRIELATHGSTVFIQLTRPVTGPEFLRRGTVTQVSALRAGLHADRFIVASPEHLVDRDGDVVTFAEGTLGPLAARSTDASMTGGRFDRESLSALAEARPDALLADEERVAAFFLGPVFDAERLGQAARVVARLAASETDAPYR